MKVIFLDNDGVICLCRNWGKRYKKYDAYVASNPEMADKTWRDFPVDCRFDDFDDKAVKVLNEILEETGAEIVVSSDWRMHATVDELGDYYESQGISKRPIDGTPFCKDIPVPKNVSLKMSDTHLLEKKRHIEILHWLSEHPEVTHWVAVDDLHMGVNVEDSNIGPFERDWGLTNFVWTPYDCEGIKQTGVKEKILKFLI